MLAVPGPTPLPEDVLKAVGKQMISHKGKKFSEMLMRIINRSKEIFLTENDVFLISASGTGGLEAAASSFLYSGDEVISFSGGYFGERWWRDIARRKSIVVRRCPGPEMWDHKVRRDEVEEMLALYPFAKAVLFTHNETSTGVQNDIGVLAETVRKIRPNTLIFVDAVSSLGAIPLETDRWGLDVVISASQKGLMAPPALSLISVSEKAWAKYDLSRVDSFYFDLGIYRKYMEKGETPATPNLSAMYGLDKSLEMILDEGLENVFKRHKHVAHYFRTRASEAGWEMFADMNSASDTVTALKIPRELQGQDVVGLLEKEYDIVVAKGLGSLAGKIIRVAHMGYGAKEETMDIIIAALRDLRAKSLRNP